MGFIESIIYEPLVEINLTVYKILGDLTGLFDTSIENVFLGIYQKGNFVTISLDYESTGILDMFVYISLLWFFSIYNFLEKTVLSLVGIIVIFIGNVIRILIICYIMATLGVHFSYFMQTLVGRLIFYTVYVILCYCVFTKQHILRQKVGNFSYESSDV